jgi:predicted GNAT family N-acyltransferase
MPARSFRIRLVTWDKTSAELRSVREEVFIREQGVPPELEWDGEDPACVHALAVTRGGEAIGTARLTADGHIGRMAVRRPWRGQGVGSALLEAMMRAARRQGLDRVVLHAQLHARDFYARFGFRAEGGEFLDAGIPHVRMAARISPGSVP